MRRRRSDGSRSYRHRHFRGRERVLRPRETIRPALPARDASAEVRVARLAPPCKTARASGFERIDPVESATVFVGAIGRRDAIAQVRDGLGVRDLGTFAMSSQRVEPSDLGRDYFALSRAETGSKGLRVLSLMPTPLAVLAYHPRPCLGERLTISGLLIPWSWVRIPPGSPDRGPPDTPLFTSRRVRPPVLRSPLHPFG